MTCIEIQYLWLPTACLSHIVLYIAVTAPLGGVLGYQLEKRSQNTEAKS